MNAPQDLGPEFRAWMRDVPPMPAELPRHTLEHTTDTRQRRRWLWFLPGPKPTAGADDRLDLADPAATTQTRGGLRPARTGGTRTMFSATKMIGIAAAVALLGALMLAGPLGPPQEAPRPAAEAPQPGEITAFSGTLRVLGADSAGKLETHGWGTSRTGEQWTVRIQTDDPRYTGVETGYHNVYYVDPDKSDLRAYNGRFFTKGGSWVTTGRGYQDPATTGIQYQAHAVGEGDYEGLFAISSCGQRSFSTDFECEGVIFEGGLPETPGAAPDTIPAIHLGP